MNIFYLDRDPAKAAKDMCDKHVVKMVLESTQILSTVLNKYITVPGAYKSTHRNHPCVLWAAKSAPNFYWLLTHALNLDLEYSFRYNKTHASHNLLCTIAAYYNSERLDRALPWTETEFTDPPQCMPDQYKNNDTVIAYRQYYKGEKSRFAKWAYSDEPEWW